MARPVTIPTEFAAEATYDAGSGVPAGLIGQPVRVSPPLSWYEFGFVPGGTFLSQYANQTIGVLSEWAVWVSEGTSTMTKTAHPVETDSSGIGRLWGLRLGDGTATGLNATEKLTIIGDGTQRAIDITTVATSLHALRVTAASTSTNAVKIEQTGAGRSALELIGPGGASVAALTVDGDSGTGVSATVTGANGAAVEGTASAGSAPGVAGVGAAFGVTGDATTSGGSGGRFTSAAGAGSSGEGAACRGLGDAVGARCTAEDGNAVVASATGEEDAVVVLAAGDGAAIRMDPQTDPAVQRAGQLWASDIATDQAGLRFCSNSTGLGSPTDYYVHIGEEPEYRAAGWDAGPTNIVANTSTWTQLATTTLPIYITCDVAITCSVMVLANPIGDMGTQSVAVLRIRDVTSGVTVASVIVDLIDGLKRAYVPLMATYTIPATGSRNLKLEAQVPNGTTGSLDFYNAAIFWMTASAKTG